MRHCPIGPPLPRLPRPRRPTNRLRRPPRIRRNRHIRCNRCNRRSEAPPPRRARRPALGCRLPLLPLPLCRGPAAAASRPLAPSARPPRRPTAPSPRCGSCRGERRCLRGACGVARRQLGRRGGLADGALSLFQLGGDMRDMSETCPRHVHRRSPSSSSACAARASRAFRRRHH